MTSANTTLPIGLRNTCSTESAIRETRTHEFLTLRVVPGLSS